MAPLRFFYGKELCALIQAGPVSLAKDDGIYLCSTNGELKDRRVRPFHGAEQFAHGDDWVAHLGVLSVPAQPMVLEITLTDTDIMSQWFCAS